MNDTIDPTKKFCSELFSVAEKLNEQITKLNVNIAEKLNDAKRKIAKVTDMPLISVDEVDDVVADSTSKIQEYVPDVSSMADNLNSVLQNCLGGDLSSLLDELPDFPGELSSSIFDTFLDTDSAAGGLSDFFNDKINENLDHVLGSISKYGEKLIIDNIEISNNEIKDTGIKNIMNSADKILNCLSQICPDMSADIQNIMDNMNLIQDNLHMTDNGDFDKTSFINNLDVPGQMKSNASYIVDSLDSTKENVKNNIVENVKNKVSDIRKEIGFE